MWNSDEPIHPRNIPEDGEIRRLLANRNQSLMSQRDAERRMEYFSGTINYGDAVDPEGFDANLRAAAQFRTEVASYDSQLIMRGYDPDV